MAAFISSSMRSVYFNQSRSYVKGLKRKAIRVFLQDEATHVKTSHGKSSTEHADIPGGRGPAIVDLNVKTSSSTGINSSSYDSVQSTSQVKIEVLCPGDKRFGPVVADAKSLPARRVKGLILLEGKRLVREAVSTGQELKSLFFTKNESLDGLPLQDLVNSGVKLYKVKADHMQLWSDTVTPQGLMAICKMPKTSVEKSASSKTIPVTLICDGILDPGVLGTLLRSAVAAGCSKILITRGKGTLVDGSTIGSFIFTTLKTGTILAGTVGNGEQCSSPCSPLIGCVDAWEPKVLRSGAGSHFRAPSLITGLNWDLVANYLSPDVQLFLVSPLPTASTSGSNRKAAETDRHSSKRSKVVATLPVVLLDDVICSSSDEVAVVVSDSPSVEALQLVCESGGSRLQLRSNGEVGLLNSALLGSVTLFEFARQLRRSVFGTSSSDRADGDNGN